MKTAQKPSAFMKAMNMNPKTNKNAWHFEARKGTEQQAVDYATKEDTRMDGTFYHHLYNIFEMNQEEVWLMHKLCRIAHRQHWCQRTGQEDGSGISSGDDEEHEVIAGLGRTTPNDLREVSPWIRSFVDGAVQQQQGPIAGRGRVRTLGANRHRKNEEGIRHGYKAPRRTTGDAVLR